MAHGPLPALFLIRGHAVDLHEIDDRPGRPQALFTLEQAVPDRDQGMGARAVEAEGRFPRHGVDGKDGFVAIALGQGARPDGGGDAALFSEAAQAVVHMLLLHPELFFIAHVPQGAAAAEVRAVRDTALRRGLQQAQAFRPDGGGRYLENQNFPAFAGHGGGDEHRPSLQAADPVPLGGAAVNPHLGSLILRQHSVSR